MPLLYCLQPAGAEEEAVFNEAVYGKEKLQPQQHLLVQPQLGAGGGAAAQQRAPQAPHAQHGPPAVPLHPEQVVPQVRWGGAVPVFCERSQWRQADTCEHTGHLPWHAPGCASSGYCLVIVQQRSSHLMSTPPAHLALVPPPRRRRWLCCAR